MKLLMVSGDRSLLEGKRGAFWYTLEEFSTHWDRIDIICPKSNNADSKTPDVPSGNIALHPSPKGLWYQPLWIRRKGIELYSTYKHDVMTVHEYPPFYNGFGAAMMATKIRIPYALELHHLVGYPIPSGWKEWVARKISPRFLPGNCRASTKVRTVNTEVMSQLVTWGVDPDHIAVVPSFYLDATALRPDASIEKRYDMVFCARLVANKGLSAVLKAVKMMDGRRLLVIGDGPLRTKMEKLAASLGIADRVTFSGWLPEKEDVYSALQGARVFVMNSVSEGGPRVALEAMALGIPVVSTAVGVMPDVIEDDLRGVLCTGVPGDLVEKIEKLLDDEQYAQKISQQGKTILDYFERSSLIAHYADFLKSLV